MLPDALVELIVPEVIEFRPLDPADACAISTLVRQVFDEHVASSFDPEGVSEMHRHIAPEAIAERARTHETITVWQGTRAVGVIEVRDTDHISMLFVCTSHMGLGIATALVARAEEICRAAGRSAMTVHSSLGAQSFYERLGFVPTSEPQKVQGFAFVSMEKLIQ
jgi:GNAT superfamily N-acetyltransferase